MKGYNRVILVGNLAQDPQERYLPSGDAIVNFTVCVSRNYRTVTGEQREETNFIPIVVYGKQAEVCRKYLKKGEAVLVEGHLRQRSWETQEGQRRTILEVICSSVQFLGQRQPLKETLFEGEEELPLNHRSIIRYDNEEKV